jgi:phosphoglycolate phosphatase-like HAD superfamily hydrolase
MISTIFFDFDGVILDSVDVKTDAFMQLYSEFGVEVVSSVKKHHLENGGMSRFEKFSFYHKNFLGIELSTKEIDILADKFSSMVVQKVINSDPIRGSLDFIEDFYTSYDMYIVSGTPQSEIRQIAGSLNLTRKMKGVFGSPEKKEIHVDEIIKKQNYRRSDCLFIGDARADHTAAVINEIKFMLIENDENSMLFSDVEGISRSQDLANLQQYILEKL